VSSIASVRVPGLDARAQVWRDPQGIPHARAESSHDAFVAQGFVHAQDRLFQMDYDRRRAYGRWAELAGAGAVAQDVQMRRFRLAASARADYAALDAETRAMVDAYARGVNAFIATMSEPPMEYGLLGTRPERWDPWDACAVFKVRHVLMGTWQLKVWRGRLLRHLGAEMTARLCPGTQPNPMLIIPPGVEYDGSVTDGLAALQSCEAALTAMTEWDMGSNSWVVAGSRTASGRPLLAGDPHRALDVPNVYYQNHLACPDFDVVGLSFAGVPGFPHFGHNASVAWCVTHANADYQDVFIERFDGNGRYEFRGEWRPVEAWRETIGVRGAAPVTIDLAATHHGPIVLGDPKTGYALALRYTATCEANPTFRALLPMLRARSADELEAAMRPWVDPGNNFVFADVHGAIGYRTRGRVPVRNAANAWVPVPGWDGAHEWQGNIPFEEMPAMRNPATGWIATANSRIIGRDTRHYIGLDFAPDFRTRRLVERLRDLKSATVEDMAAIHADRVSVPARELIEILARVRPSDAASREALDLLLAWDGVMDRDAVAPLVYSAFRDRVMRSLMTPILGPLAGEAFGGAPRGSVAHMARLRARLGEMIRRDDRTLLPAGIDWPTALARALAEAVADLRSKLGDDLASWRWGRVHTTRPEHPLSSALPVAATRLNPPRVAMGGDAETVQAAAFIAGAGYTVTNTSVARYVFDLADWEQSAWVVPLGASGDPRSPHYADQLEAWSEARLLPMRYGWSRIRDEAETHQALEPA